MGAICKNCDVSLEPSYDYCPNCSQKTALHRLGVHDIVHETVHYFTHADKGLFQLLRDLVIKRGLVAKEFIEGKRKKYFPPLNFFFLVGAFYVLTGSLYDNYGKVDVFETHPELHQINDPVKKAQSIAVYQRLEEGMHYFRKYGNVVTMLALPLTAFIFWLFYKKGKYNYIEHLVACMFMYSICTFVFTCGLLLGYFAGIDEDYMHGFFLTIQIAYYSVFYYGFMGTHTKAKAWKAFGVSFASMFVLWMLSWVLMLMYIYNIIG